MFRLHKKRFVNGPLSHLGAEDEINIISKNDAFYDPSFFSRSRFHVTGLADSIALRPAPSSIFAAFPLLPNLPLRSLIKYNPYIAGRQTAELWSPEPTKFGGSSDGSVGRLFSWLNCDWLAGCAGWSAGGSQQPYCTTPHGNYPVPPPSKVTEAVNITRVEGGRRVACRIRTPARPTTEAHFTTPQPNF